MAKRKLVWSSHAKERMKEREVEGWEVIDALKHGHWGTNDKGQLRVKHRLDAKNRLLVGIEVAPSDDKAFADIVTVVTVIIRGPRDNGVGL